MSKLLKILHVEDDFDYSDMFQLQMNRIAKRKQEEEFSFVLVPSVEEAIQKIDEKEYDCIVCDYQIIGGNGLDILKEMRKRNVFTPIIFLTGQGDEQVAREAFVHGANDYFTKDVGFVGYDRIYNSILRYMELFETSMQKKEAENKYQTIFETGSTAIVMLEEDRTISLVNSKFEELSGYTKEEVENRKKWTEFVTKDDLERMKKYHRNRRVDGKSAPSEYEFQFVTKDGGVRDIFLSVGMIPGTKRSVASFLDITEEKRINKRIEHLNSVLKAIRNVNQMVVKERDKNTLLQKTCDTLIETRGYTAAWIGLLKDGNDFSVIKGAGLGKYISRFAKEMLAGNRPYCIKEALSRKEDIMLFYSRGEECKDCFFKDSHPEEGVAIMRIEYENELFGLLAIILAPDMTVDEEEKELLSEVAGDVAFSLHMMSLEEKRKEAEENLRKEKDRAQKYLDVAGVMIYLLDKDYNIIQINKRGCEILGYDDDKDIVGRNWVDNFIPEKYKDNMKTTLDKVISGKTGIIEYNENSILDKNGEERILAWQDTLIKDENDICILTSGEDITEKKKAEKRINHLNSVLKAIRNINQLVVRDKNKETMLQMTCNILTEARGYEAIIIASLNDKNNFDTVKYNGFNKDIPIFCKQVKADNYPLCISKALDNNELIRIIDKTTAKEDCFFANTCIGKEVAIVRIEHNKKLMGILIIMLSGDVLIDDEEKELLTEVTGDLGFALHNIQLEKAHKTSEMMLKESEDRFRNLFNNIANSVAVYEAIDEGNDFVIKDLNNAGEKIECMNKKDIIGKRVTEVFPGVKESGIFNIFQRVWRTGKSEYFPEAVYKDERGPGSWRENWVYKLPSGEIVAVYDDITKGKQVLTQLENSEKLYKTLFNDAHEGIILVNEHEKIIDANKKCIQMCGYGPEELLMMKISDLQSPKLRMQPFHPIFSNYYHTKDTVFETKLMKKDGTELDCEITITKLEINNKNMFLSIIRDITFQKHAKNQLKKQKEELSDYAHTVAHNLKNQINIIEGYMDLQSKDKINIDEYTQRTSKHLKKLKLSIMRQLQLADAGRIIDRPEDIDLNIIIDNASKNYRELRLTSIFSFLSAVFMF